MKYFNPAHLRNFSLLLMLLLSQASLASRPVSMIQLIATPKKFAGESIGVFGFLSADFNIFKIFLNKDDYCINNLHNSVNLGIPSELKEEAESLHQHFVYVQGTYQAPVSSNLLSFGGNVEITSIVKSTDKISCEKTFIYSKDNITQ